MVRLLCIWTFIGSVCGRTLGCRPASVDTGMWTFVGSVLVGRVNILDEALEFCGVQVFFLHGGCTVQQSRLNGAARNDQGLQCPV